MIGIHPTVGCLIVMDKTRFEGVKHVVQELQSFIPITDWNFSETGPSSGRAMLGDKMQEMIVTAQENGERAFIQFEFDEDESVHVARAAKKTIEQLLMPYVEAAKKLPGVLAVALGFELSPPADFRERSLCDVGVVLLFKREKGRGFWSRKQLSPMVGHYA